MNAQDATHKIINLLDVYKPRIRSGNAESEAAELAGLIDDVIQQAINDAQRLTTAQINHSNAMKPDANFLDLFAHLRAEIDQMIEDDAKAGLPEDAARFLARLLRLWREVYPEDVFPTSGGADRTALADELMALREEADVLADKYGVKENSDG